MHNCLDCDSYSFFASVRIVYDLSVRCNNAQEITLASLSLSIVVFYYFLSFFKLFKNKINVLKQRRDAFGEYPVLKNK